MNAPSPANQSTPPWKQVSFWGLILSLVGMALSQLPPVKTWFAASAISAEVGNRAGVSSYLGLMGYQLFISLQNSGSKSITVAKLRLKLKRPDGAEQLIPAESYFRAIGGQDGPQNFPMTSVALGVGTGWSETVSFSNVPTPEQEKALGSLKIRTTQSIFDRQQKGEGRVSPMSGWTTADPAIAKEAEDLFRRTELPIGSYEATVLADVDGKETTIKRTRFVIYDFHVQTLMTQISDLQFGGGITIPKNPSKELWVVIAAVE
jgi:hypothetical protein